MPGQMFVVEIMFATHIATKWSSNPMEMLMGSEHVLGGRAKAALIPMVGFGLTSERTDDENEPNRTCRWIEFAFAQDRRSGLGRHKGLFVKGRRLIPLLLLIFSAIIVVCGAR